MKLLYLFIITIFISSCNLPQPLDPRERETLADEVLRVTALKLKKEKELIPFGTGGQTADGIKMLCLAFQYRKPINIEEGRKLLIEGVKEFAAAMNAEKDIHRYLVDYPFDAKNIILEIYIKNPDGTNCAPDSLCLVIANQGQLKYEMTDPITDRLVTVFTETYEEALQRDKGFLRQ